MPETFQDTTFYGCHLYPGSVKKIKAIMKFLKEHGDGRRPSFTDVVKWLLDQQPAKKVIDAYVE